MVTIVARAFWLIGCPDDSAALRFSAVRAFTVTVVSALMIVLPGPVTAAADDGLQLAASTTYELQPDAGRVRVSMDVSLTNLLADRGNEYYYFDRIGIPVLAEATNVSAERVGGGGLAASVQGSNDPLWSTLTVRLSPVLRYHQPQQLRISYDLPGLPPRSENWTRATEAYALFLTYAIGDPGLADVTVVVPSGYTELDAGGTSMDRRLSGGNWVYSATGIAEPEEWWAIFAARNDDLLSERQLSVGDHDAVLRYWPDDHGWADFAEETVGSGIPVLEDLIGLPWPVEGELEITESSAPHAYGYGGWYHAGSDTIEVSDELDQVVMLHELAHAWFNRGFSVEAWFLEGLAELYAHQALAALEGSAPAPERPSASRPGALPLASWEQVPFESNDHDEYVYAAAWWLLDRIYAEIGAAAMADVVAAAADKEVSYRSDLEPESMSSRVDWRRILDLFVEVGGSAAAVDLYREYVVSADDAELLDERETARATYADLVEAAQGWSAPLELREAMTLWDFDEVDEFVAASGQVLAHRDDVLAVLGDLGISELPALEDTYQGAALIADVIAERSGTPTSLR